MAYEHRNRYRCFNCGKEADSTADAASSCPHSSCGFSTGRWEGFVESFKVSEAKPTKISDAIYPFILSFSAIIATKVGAPDFVGTIGAMLGLLVVGGCFVGFVFSFVMDDFRDWTIWLGVGWIGGGAALWLLVSWATA